VVGAEAEPAGVLLPDVFFEDGLILGRQRGLLPVSPWFGLVERRLAAKATHDKARPGAAQIRMHRSVGALRTDGHHQNGCKGKDSTQASVRHGDPPSMLVVVGV